MEYRKALSKPGPRKFLLQLCVLAAAFVLISLIIGGSIVPGPLLYGLGFYIYGGMGYIALAMAIFFVVYAREKLLRIKKVEWGYWWLWPLTALLVTAFYLGAWHVKRSPELAASQPILWGAVLHTTFIVMFLCLGYAVFHPRFVRRFVKDFRKEILVCLGIGVAFYASMQLVWKSWELLSFGVSRLVYAALRVFPSDPLLIPPQTISVQGFGVYIGEACSGVFSIFLFTCLYLLIVALDWKKISHWKAVALFPLAVIGLFLTNVLRVYLIVLVGVYYDPVFAVNLFHSYVGMLLFIAFFLGFQWLTTDWMKK
jgi:exosortase/archaeosortase family protein